MVYGVQCPFQHKIRLYKVSNIKSKLNGIFCNFDRIFYLGFSFLIKQFFSPLKSK
jgi:hypothetical protein